MVTSGEAELPKLRPFRPLRSSLPCDVHLLNLRTLEDEHVVEFTFTKIVENFWCLLDVKSNFFVCFGKQEAETPSQEAALLLHRRGFDCGSTPDVPLQCTWSAHEEVTHIHTFTVKIVKNTFYEGFPFLTDNIKHFRIKMTSDLLSRVSVVLLFSSFTAAQLLNFVLFCFAGEFGRSLFSSSVSLCPSVGFHSAA